MTVRNTIKDVVEEQVQEIVEAKNLVPKATPKFDLSWYVKWVSSFFILVAVACRSVGGELVLWDLIFSAIGTLGWLWVGLLWNDRALIILNGTLFTLLISGLLKIIVELRMFG